MIRAANAAGVPNRVLPDGCSDIILGIGDVPGPVAVGTMRTAAIHELSGRVDMLGVRFHPGCGLPFVGIPLSAAIATVASLVTSLALSSAPGLVRFSAATAVLIVAFIALLARFEGITPRSIARSLRG